MKSKQHYRRMRIKAELEKSDAFRVAKIYALATFVASVGLSLAALISAISLLI